MKARILVAAGALGAVFSSSAFAEDGSLSGGRPTSRMAAQAQVEMLPLGSANTTLQGVPSTAPDDTAVAYGITAMFDYAINPYLSIGVAPRLVLNVAAKDADDSGRELDLRARIVGRYPVSPALQLYASVSPGYAILMAPGGDPTPDLKGFAIAGAVGLTYDVSPQLFLSGEAGYQRAFTSSDVMVAPGQTLSLDTELSYMHVGLGAGTRF